jgi:hypothetical protein
MNRPEFDESASSHDPETGPVADGVATSTGIPATRPTEDQPDDGGESGPVRDKVTGRWVKGNPGGVVLSLHGRARRQLPVKLAEADRLAADLLRQSLADDGGEAEQPARRRTLHQYRSFVHAQILRIAATLQASGTFTRHGKLRERPLMRLESLIATAVKLDSQLGLTRRTKDIGAMSLSDYVASVTEPAGTEPGPDPEPGGPHADPTDR